ncbi:MAG: DUF1614 domain-containing protein [Thermoplasmatota archaeon]
MLLDTLPWPLLMAAGSLATVGLAYLYRPDVFARFGFGREEVALVTLGSLAGWAVNLPIAPLGQSLLTLNVGGALLALLLAGIWLYKRVLPPVRTVGGIALVAVVAHAVVQFDPAQGIVALFPYFFLPPIAAFLYAVLVCAPDPRKSVPVGFTSGSIGALVGADLVNLPAVGAHFTQSATDSAIVSVGGAGVFDMVFLAGVLPMAMGILLLIMILPRAPKARAYPAQLWEVPDPADTWQRFTALEDANELERAVASLGLAGRALEESDYARSVRMSYLAVDSVLRAGTPPLSSRLTEWPTALSEDILLLERAYSDAKNGTATREAAGAAERTAKAVVGALGPHAGVECRFGGPRL